MTKKLIVRSVLAIKQKTRPFLKMARIFLLLNFCQIKNNQQGKIIIIFVIFPESFFQSGCTFGKWMMVL